MPVQPLSKWMPAVKPSMAKNTDPNEQRGVFVDEFTCIGCKVGLYLHVKAPGPGS